MKTVTVYRYQSAYWGSDGYNEWKVCVQVWEGGRDDIGDKLLDRHWFDLKKEAMAYVRKMYPKALVLYSTEQRRKTA